MILKYSFLKTAGATQQQIDAASKKLGISSENLLSLANQFDPTKEKKFEAWVVKQMGFENIRLPEDGNRLKQVLEDFIKLSNKKQLSKRDINQYPRIHDLEAEIDKIKGIEVTQETSSKLQEYLALNGVTLFAQNSEWLILAVDDPGSASQLASGTKWCTSDPATAEGYISEFWLGIIFKKTGTSLEKMYQMTADFQNFMDVKDNHLNSIDPSLMRLLLDTYANEQQLRKVVDDDYYWDEEGIPKFYSNGILFALSMKFPISNEEFQTVIYNTTPELVNENIKKSGRHEFRDIWLRSDFDVEGYQLRDYFQNHHEFPRWVEFERMVQDNKFDWSGEIEEQSIIFSYVLNVKPFGRWMKADKKLLSFEIHDIKEQKEYEPWFRKMWDYLDRNNMYLSGRWFDLEAFLLETTKTLKDRNVLRMVASFAVRYWVLCGDDTEWAEMDAFIREYGYYADILRGSNMTPEENYLYHLRRAEEFQQRHKKLNVV